MAGRIRTGTRQAPQRYRLTPTRHRPDAILLANAARPALPASFGPAIHGLVLIYAIPVWGFAIVWLTIWPICIGSSLKIA